jgi:predicted DNA-binding protein
MKSVRLGQQLERRLEEVARITGQSTSKLIRDAVRRHCDEYADSGLAGQLADVVGAVASGGRQSRKTGRGFLDHVRKKHGNRRRRST